jgi:hypothetical protein
LVVLKQRIVMSKPTTMREIVASLYKNGEYSSAKSMTVYFLEHSNAMQHVGDKVITPTDARIDKAVDKLLDLSESKVIGEDEPELPEIQGQSIPYTARRFEAIGRNKLRHTQRQALKELGQVMSTDDELDGILDKLTENDRNRYSCDLDEAKQAIKTYTGGQVSEAYKRGYTQRGIDEVKI